MDKNRYIFNYYSQKENNATKAFLNVLEHSVQELTKNFFRFFLKFETSTNEFDFKHQVVNKQANFSNPKAKNFLIGISENNEIKFTKDKAKLSVPDGGIFPKGKGDFNVILETKVGKNSYLIAGQLQRHIEVLESKSDVLFVAISWDQIREFFRDFKTLTNDPITTFLLEHFENFCITNDIGINVIDNDYWFYKFGDYEYIARYLDNLIMNKMQYKVHYQNTRNYGIGYHKDPDSGTHGFAKLHVGGDIRCLILRYGSSNDNFGIELQKEVYNELNLQDRRSESNSNAQPNELFIYLDWIKQNNISESKLNELIELSYEKRYALLGVE